MKEKVAKKKEARVMAEPEMMNLMQAPVRASSMAAPPPPPGAMMRQMAYEMADFAPSSKMAYAADMSMDMDEMEMEKEEAAYSEGEEDDDYLEERQQQQQFYKVLDKTKEYAENNYYKLPISRQDNSLIPINAFWADFANYSGSGAFLSKNFVLAASNFTEVMFVVSVLDLSMSTGTKDEALDVAFEDTKMILNTKKATIAFHKEIKECPVER